MAPQASAIRRLAVAPEEDQASLRPDSRDEPAANLAG
jgi:hypothetical protein